MDLTVVLGAVFAIKEKRDRVRPAERPNQTVAFALTRLGAVTGALLALALLIATPASASYEQVGTISSSDEGGIGRETIDFEQPSFAVNVTGAGGVSPGTVYVAIKGRILRYTATGEFREAWGWGVADEPTPAAAFQRCGPDGEAAHPSCSGHGISGTGTGQIDSPTGIAIDPSTGNVYVLDGTVKVFSPDGSRLFASFGEQGPRGGEPIDSSPAKFHIAQKLAVDAEGNVYVGDLINPGYESRVMVFSPQSPEDYEHYVYTGRSHDIAKSHGSIAYFSEAGVALDSTGALYIGEVEKIWKFSPGEPAAPACEYRVPGGGLTSMTVNPITGEVFYFSYKNRKLHQLSACDGTGKFEETSTFAPTVNTEQMLGLAVNPTLSFSASRPPGIIYGAGSVYDEREPGVGTNFAQADIFAPAEIHNPTVESESTGAVGVSFATLKASINPHGSQTRFVFQYIADSEYESNPPDERFAGAAEAPAGGAELGSGQIALTAAATLGSLRAGTVYHYRVIATSNCEPEAPSQVCSGTGEAREFRTFAAEAPGLPDGRAYELVSPAQKHGGEVIPMSTNGSCEISTCKPSTFSSHFPMQSAPDGESVVYQGFPFSLTGDAPVFDQYLSRRTPSGWSTETLSPELLDKNSDSKNVAVDQDLTRGIVFQTAPSLSGAAPANYPNLYDFATGGPLAFRPLVTSPPVGRSPIGAGGNEGFSISYAGASADLSHIIFGANAVLTGETPFSPDPPALTVAEKDLYEWTEDGLRLVNVLPGNAGVAPGATFGSPATEGAGAISDDGSRVFWTSGTGQLYVREGGESSSEIPGAGAFLTVSADGSKVLLDDGSLYGLDDHSTIDLTDGQGGFLGVAGHSTDLSTIYFVDTAALTGLNAEGKAPNEHGAAEDNLYVWQDGQVSFIATLRPQDNQVAGGAGDSEARGTWRAVPARRSAEASPNGQRLAFVSGAPLTGYDNNGPTCIKSSTQDFVPGACLEVFQYDSGAERLVCASCNPTGSQPRGKSFLSLDESGEAYRPQVRYLTDSGRLFFNSEDVLSPYDTNGRTEDVYQYEPDGVGSCTREEGCISLISSGTGTTDSEFLASDATGRNAFFVTRAQLLLRDRDDLYDLYDAREGGGIAGETEVSRAECEGEACQPVPSAPNDPTPASSSFQGAGNVKKPSNRRCARGKVREHGRCVRKVRHRKKRHKKHRSSKNTKRSSSTTSHHRGGAM